MKTILTTALLSLCLAAPAFADTLFSGTGKTVSTQLCYFVTAPAPSQSVLISYLNATSDKAGSLAQFYTAGSPIPVTGSSTNGASVVKCTGTRLATNDVVVVVSGPNTATPSAFRHTVSIITSSNVTFAQATTSAFVYGDSIYRMTAAASVPVGAANLKLGPENGYFYVGQSGKPVLIQLDSTSSGTLSLITGALK